MNYGLSVINFRDHLNPNIVAGLAREAEEAGWDGFFLWDHILVFRDRSVPRARGWRGPIGRMRDRIWKEPPREDFS